MKTFLAALAAVLALSACGVTDADLVQGSDDAVVLDDQALTVNARFETYVGKDGQHYFHLIAGNGEKVLASEGYTTASGATSGINTVKNNGVLESRYLIRQATDGSFYFVLVGGNGSIIGVSEMYASQSNALRAATTVQNIIKTVVAQTAAATGTAKFEIFQGADGKYYFHARALNGEIVLQSQGYTTKSGATSGMTSVQTNGAIATRYEVREARDGKFYFVLKAGNGWVIGRGETYASQSNAERGVATCVELLSGTVQR
jgi:uncharacterized protein YegP (UPF0339 family)